MFKFAKYAQRYLADVQYRFSRRFGLVVMELKLTIAVMRAKYCPNKPLSRDSELGI